MDHHIYSVFYKSGSPLKRGKVWRDWSTRLGSRKK